jgi:hypothetical protein
VFGLDEKAPFIRVGGVQQSQVDAVHRPARAWDHPRPAVRCGGHDTTVERSATPTRSVLDRGRGSQHVGGVTVGW